MDVLNAIILGIIQGLTEFLPVSSSGHLEIFKVILGDNKLPNESPQQKKNFKVIVFKSKFINN